jgi:RNA polymerase sigma-70 factor, ECF subfamily
LSAALQIVLGRLRPNERAVFLLREVFEFEYAEIAAILEETESNCRQLLRRARGKIGAGGAVPSRTDHEAELLLEQFLAASQSGEFEPLLSLMCEEPVLLRDAGNVGMPMPEPIFGRAALIEFFKSLREHLDEASLTIRTIGEKYQLAEWRERSGGLAGAFIATVRDRQIVTVRQISCPTKLRFLDRILRGEIEA